MTSTFFEKGFFFIIFLLLINYLFYLFIDHIIERFLVCFDWHIIKIWSVVVILVIWFNGNFIKIYELLFLRLLFGLFSIIFLRFLIFNRLFEWWRVFVKRGILFGGFNWHIIKIMFHCSRFDWYFIKIMFSGRFNWHFIKIMFILLIRLIVSLKFIYFNLFLFLVVNIFGWSDGHIIKVWKFRVFDYFRFRLFFRNQRFLVIFLIQIDFFLFIFKFILGFILQFRLVVVCLRFWNFWI